MSSQLILVIILALVFEFINGMRDSSNIVATMISSRAFRPNTALGVTAVAEFVGGLFAGCHHLEHDHMVSGHTQQFISCVDWRPDRRGCVYGWFRSDQP